MRTLSSPMTIATAQIQFKQSENNLDFRIDRMVL